MLGAKVRQSLVSPRDGSADVRTGRQRTPAPRHAPPSLTTAAAAIGLSRTAGNAAVAGLATGRPQRRVARISGQLTHTLDNVSLDWDQLIQAFRANAGQRLGIGLAPLAQQAAPNFAQAVQLPEPTTRAAWMTHWQRVWQIKGDFQAAVRGFEQQKGVANQRATQARKRNNAAAEAAALQDVAAANTAIAGIRPVGTPLVTFPCCGYTVHVDRGQSQTAGAKDAGWVRVDPLTTQQMKYDVLAVGLTQEQQQAAANNQPPALHAAMVAQIQRIRQIVSDGPRPAGATAREVGLANIWFGSEFMRNPDSFGMGLMMLDLMERGAHYGTGNKPYTWVNVLSASLRPNETNAQWTARKASGGVLITDPSHLADWGGKHPMSPKGSEAQGGAALGAQPNVVHAKEASLLAHWMQARGSTTQVGLAAQLATL